MKASVFFLCAVVCFSVTTHIVAQPDAFCGQYSVNVNKAIPSVSAYAYFDGTYGVTTCCTLCTGDSRCNAWSLYNSRCSLFANAGVGNLTTLSGATAGVTISNATCGRFTILPGAEFVLLNGQAVGCGALLPTGFVMDTMAQCCALCSATAGCYGYSFGSFPNTADSRNWCHLKNADVLPSGRCKPKVYTSGRVFTSGYLTPPACTSNPTAGATVWVPGTFSLNNTRLAVDGNLNTYVTVANTANANTWLEARLAAPTVVSSVTITNRRDCCLSSLGTFWLFVSDVIDPSYYSARSLQYFGNATVFAERHCYREANSNSQIVVRVPNMRARFVKVLVEQSFGTSPLSIAEVAVGCGAVPPFVPSVPAGPCTAATASSSASISGSGSSSASGSGSSSASAGSSSASAGSSSGSGSGSSSGGSGSSSRSGSSSGWSSGSSSSSGIPVPEVASVTVHRTNWVAIMIPVASVCCCAFIVGAIVRRCRQRRRAAAYQRVPAAAPSSGPAPHAGSVQGPAFVAQPAQIPAHSPLYDWQPAAMVPMQQPQFVPAPQQFSPVPFDHLQQQHQPQQYPPMMPFYGRPVMAAPGAAFPAFGYPAVAHLPLNAQAFAPAAQNPGQRPTQNV
eukprot:TRINITY_DN187_c0_g1_i3.p1 TRINITY_DN187_c0_g1~~TRINITY_DN187_c0_g1_i3.p1  ORF type:complete len:620 (-),score=182.63 TRINITY_DN187_c0_g1_i3:288-2147(-)